MKAISIKEPYAAAIALGYSSIENRTWRTRYRGPLLIHASKTLDDNWFSREGAFLYRTFRQRYETDLVGLIDRADFPTGGIIGIANLVDVLVQGDPLEKSYLPWFEGPYGFVLREQHALPFLPMNGQLGIFTVPPDIAEAVEFLLHEQKEVEDRYEFAQ